MSQYLSFTFEIFDRNSNTHSLVEKAIEFFFLEAKRNKYGRLAESCQTKLLLAFTVFGFVLLG